MTRRSRMQARVQREHHTACRHAAKDQSRHVTRADADELKLGLYMCFAGLVIVSFVVKIFNST